MFTLKCLPSFEEFVEKDEGVDVQYIILSLFLSVETETQYSSNDVLYTE